MDMKTNKEKYCGILPAFYACYEKNGEVSLEKTKALARHLKDKGVKGLYVSGSSGECIYQSVEERKRTLNAVMEEVGGSMTIIAHVGANSTRDSVELAQYSESLKVDAIASIPPIYFKLPEYAIAGYWNDISAAAPNTDFIIYNIPQLAGVSLTVSLFKEMLKNPRVVGVKNSSMPVQDIQTFKSIGGEDFTVFNGPDEQFVAGRIMGADGGIGGTYAVMPELFLKAEELVKNGEFGKAQQLQFAVNDIIVAMCSCHGNLYAVMKEIIRLNGLDLGSVRPPLPALIDGDMGQVEKCRQMIDAAIKNFVN